MFRPVFDGDAARLLRAAAEGLLVVVSCPVPAKGEEGKSDAPKPKPAPPDTTTTDKFGSYKLNVKEEGKCTLTLVVDKQAVPIEVFSYKAATRYDLILEKQGAQYTLRRK